MQHEQRQPRAGDHHHGGGADEQHDVAQRDRHRRADRGLDLGGVGGEPREDLAGLGLVEIGDRERREVVEHVAAQVGDDALAERDDEVVARRARHREHAGDRDHHREIAVDQVHALVGEPEVDHAAHRERHRQRRQRRDQQRGQRRERPAAVARDIGDEREQRPELRPAATAPAARAARLRHGLRRFRRQAGPLRRGSFDHIHARRNLTLRPLNVAGHFARQCLPGGPLAIWPRLAQGLPQRGFQGRRLPQRGRHDIERANFRALRERP